MIVLGRVDLGADLRHALVARGVVRHQPAFHRKAAHRLFAVDIFARLQRIQGHEGMPVRRGCDRDSIDVLVGKQVTVVSIPLGAALREGDGAVQIRRMHVAHRPDLNVRVFAEPGHQRIIAASRYPDETHHDLLICRCTHGRGPHCSGLRTGRPL